MILVENTAIATGVAHSAKLLNEITENTEQILDYGAGRLRNTRYLKEQGHHVTIIDTPLQIKRNQGIISELGIGVYDDTKQIEDDSFKYILCSYVLNVIVAFADREALVFNINRILTAEGKAFIEVRRTNGVLKNKYLQPYGDGYIIGKNNIQTFQKPFEAGELVDFLEFAGLRVDQTIRKPDSLICICSKTFGK